MGRHNLELLLGPRIGGGKRSNKPDKLIRIRNVLPAEVAEGALALVESFPQKEWAVSDSKSDAEAKGGRSYGAGSTQHRYEATCSFRMPSQALDLSSSRHRYAVLPPELQLLGSVGNR